MPSCPNVSEGQYHTHSHLFLFVPLGSSGQAESLTCKDEGYTEYGRSPNSISQQQNFGYSRSRISPYRLYFSEGTN